MSSRSRFVNTFPPFPKEPIRRLEVLKASNHFTVAGCALVRARPFRRVGEARAIANRIGVSRIYLALALHVGMPGVEDLRPGRSTTPSYGLRRKAVQHV